MDAERDAREIVTDYELQDYTWTWIEAFLLDCRAQNLTPGTINYYRKKLKRFAQFCDSQAVKGLLQVESDLVRRFLFWLEEQGNNPGGVLSQY